MLAVLPRPSKSKRCTKCGSAGPFRHRRKGDRVYWRSWCVVCDNAAHAAWMAGHAEGNRAYQRRWAQHKRLQRAQAALAERATRQLLNLVGRLTCPPGRKWCAWGQHAPRVQEFYTLQRAKDGLQYVCKACQDQQKRLRDSKDTG